MAQQQGQPINIDYKVLRLFEDQVLGHGSYGNVCKAKYDDLLCAAKIIHLHLCNRDAQLQVGPQREHRHPVNRFMTECEFLKAIRHPNIVQFLGVTEHPQLHVPVLLTELMDCSLTHFLETAQLPIPYHVQVNFCHDISLALSFLHSNEIIHRDLSSNNVLLIGDVRAKVTDFGMAKLSCSDSRAISMTQVPGTDAYMPPEAVENQPVYTEKIDSFSFGVTMLQILTRKFPEPGNRQQQIEHPNYPTDRIKRCVPEVERRQKHINEVEESHPLLRIVHECIKDKADERPTSQELCRMLESRKDDQRYSQSRNNIQVKQSDTTSVQENQIGELQQQIEDLTQRNATLSAREQEHALIVQENQQLKQQLEQKTQLFEEKDRIMTEEKEHASITVEQLVSGFQQLNSLEHQPSQQGEAPLNQPQISVTSDNTLSSMNTVATEEVDGANASAGVATERKLEFKWKKAKKYSPYRLSRETCTAAACNGKVYFNQQQTREVYAYNPAGDSWSQLPNCPYTYSTLAVVKGSLTTVGGKDPQDAITNKLMTLDDTKQWTETFPRMLKGRCNAITVWNDSVLIVAGGVAYEVCSADVEVMDIDNSQWCKAVPLPVRSQSDIPYDSSTTSAALCGNCIYVLADNEINEYYQHQEFSNLYVCTLSTLFESCEPKFRGQIPEQNLAVSGTKWRQVNMCCRAKATCVTFNDQLLTIGGTNTVKAPQWKTMLNPYDDGTETEAIRTVHKYKSAEDSWETVSDCLHVVPRFSCFATALSNNEILVVGGYSSVSESIDRKDFADVVEIATIT